MDQKKNNTIIVEENNVQPQPVQQPVVAGQPMQPTNPTANIYQNTMQQVGNANNNGGMAAPMSSKDYYENLKQENYRALLSKEIQLANAKQNAMKATQNQLAGMGMAGSGYGAIQSTGIANNYLNAMAGAKEEYQTNQNKIMEAERTEQVKENEANFNSMVAVLREATSEAGMTKALADFGINYDPSTETMSGAGWDNLSAAQKQQLLSSVNLKMPSLKEQDFLAQNTIDDGYSDSGSAIDNLTDPFGDKGKTSKELIFIFSDSYMGTSPDGKVVKLENGRDANRYIFMIKYGNKWYKTTGEVYEKARQSGKPTDYIKGK